MFCHCKNHNEVLNLLNLSDDLCSTINECNNNYISTKHHNEDILTHLFDCATNCKRLANKFNVPEEVAFLTGFLHDIGKPFTEKILSKHSIFQGHAQIGTYIVQQLLINHFPDNYKDAVLWTIDNHMCACAHQAPWKTIDDFSDLLLLTLPKDDKQLSINLSCLLYVADSISRKTTDLIDEDECLNHSIKLRDLLLNKINNNTNLVQNICYQKKINNKKIILILYGLSGSGKSSISKQLYQAFQNQFIISYNERDSCYYEIANDLNYDTTNKTYLDLYNYIQEYDKSLVQKHWISKLNDSLEDMSNQIIIIDSVQPLFPAWTKTIDALNEDAKSIYNETFKIGIFLFPQHQLGHKFNSKIGEHSKLPNQSIWYPNINLEIGEYKGNQLDIATGFTNNVINIITKFMDKNIILEIPEQLSFLQLINKYNGLKEAIKTFPNNLITLSTEFENQNIQIIAICYEDGFQIFTGETRDYRGEVLLFDKINKIYHLLRGSLPVFPDYSSIDKDPLTLPYLDDTKINKFIVTYKYDGSLFNLTFISKLSNIYPMISILKSVKDFNLYEIENGLLIFGSKGRFYAKKSNAVNQRIMNAIRGSYSSIDKFLLEITNFINQNNYQDKNITFHFEAIDMIPTAELTVYYGKAWCPFFGYTIFDDHYKKFNLPSNSKYDLLNTTPMIEFNNWSSILTYFNENYDKLIAGDMDLEPEGYVVHIFDNETDKWFPIKLKYKFYYIAHKPNSLRNKETAKQIEKSDDYKLLRQRLAKFRDIPKLRNLIKDQLKEILNELNFNQKLDDKKTYAVYWNNRKSELENYNQELYETYYMYYPSIKINLLSIIMKLYQSEITVDHIINLI